MWNEVFPTGYCWTILWSCNSHIFIDSGSVFLLLLVNMKTHLKLFLDPDPPVENHWAKGFGPGASQTFHKSHQAETKTLERKRPPGGTRTTVWEPLHCTAAVIHYSLWISQVLTWLWKFYRLVISVKPQRFTLKAHFLWIISASLHSHLIWWFQKNTSYFWVFLCTFSSPVMI